MLTARRSGELPAAADCRETSRKSRRASPGSGGAFIDRVLRRRLVMLTAAVGVAGRFGGPLLGLHIGQSGVATLPDNLPSKQGYWPCAALLPQSRIPTQSRSSSAGGGAGAGGHVEAPSHACRRCPFGPGRSRPSSTEACWRSPSRSEVTRYHSVDVDAVTNCDNR